MLTTQKRLLIAAGACFGLSMPAAAMSRLYLYPGSEMAGGILCALAAVLLCGSFGAGMLANGE